jgi:hypothetical protein
MKESLWRRLKRAWEIWRHGELSYSDDINLLGTLNPTLVLGETEAKR